MYEKTVIAGRLGADPELRYTTKGDAVVNMSVAVGRKWTDDSGRKQEATQWYKVGVFGKQADACAKYLTKGSGCICEGHMRSQDWQDNEGKKRVSWELVAQRVVFLPGKGAESEEIPY